MSGFVNKLCNDSFESNKKEGFENTNGFATVSRKKGKKGKKVETSAVSSNWLDDEKQNSPNINMWAVLATNSKKKTNDSVSKSSNKVDHYEETGKHKPYPKMKTSSNLLDDAVIANESSEKISSVHSVRSVSIASSSKTDEKKAGDGISSFNKHRVNKQRAAKMKLIIENPNEELGEDSKIVKHAEDSLTIEFVQVLNENVNNISNGSEISTVVSSIETPIGPVVEANLNGMIVLSPVKSRSDDENETVVSNSSSSSKSSGRHISFHNICKILNDEKTSEKPTEKYNVFNDFSKYTTESFAKCVSDPSVVSIIKKDVRLIISNENTRNIHHSVARAEIDSLLNNINRNNKITNKPIFTMKTLIMLLHQSTKLDLLSIFRFIINKCEMKHYNMSHVFNSTHDNSTLINLAIWNFSRGCMEDIIGSNFVNFRVENAKGETVMEVLSISLGSSARKLGFTESEFDEVMKSSAKKNVSAEMDFGDSNESSVKPKAVTISKRELNNFLPIKRRHDTCKEYLLSVMDLEDSGFV